MEQETIDIVTLATDWIAQYGLWSVFIALILENTLLLGLFVPGVFVLIAGGFTAGVGKINFEMLCFVALLGTLIGDLISFALGRRYGERVFNLSDKTRASIEKHTWMILIFHHSPVTRMAVPAFYGMTRRFSWGRWVLLDALSAALFVGTYSYIGYLSGVYHQSVRHYYDEYQTWFSVGVLVLVALWMFPWFKRGTSAEPKVEPVPAEPQADPTGLSPR
jgi:membrane protein DedA with SNARE-associated domain